MSEDRNELLMFDEVIVKATTPKALLVELNDREHWIPKSQLGSDTDVEEVNDIGTIEIPRWLAITKRIITEDE